MLSARQLGIYIARPRFIKSSEIMSRQTTVGSLLSVAAGQSSDSIVIVCSRPNESTFFFSKVDDCILHA